MNEKAKELLGKAKYDFADLCRVMEILRGEGGCPWDREQTHESIRKNFIEETYEVVEAIDTKDAHLLCEELGDVLLQVVFHTQIEREAGEATAEQLRAMGHEVEIVDDRTAMGRGEIIWKCENGVYAAGTEPRCDGTVASW